MFDNLLRAFAEAKENFQRELGRDQSSEQIGGLLKGMEREAVETRAYLKALREQLARAERRAAGEKRELHTCRRRRKMAEEIGDDETARIAREYESKHAERHRVLSQKAVALKAELELGEGEYAEMMKQIKQARASQGGLDATLRRGKAKEAMRGDDPFTDFERMEEKINREVRRNRTEADLAEDAITLKKDELAEELEGLDENARQGLIDDRLEELKRRMGRK